ncbi:MAG: tRNA (adenosine(37)-N6)-dimethylallyltransferase MiaA [Bacteroidales bacterium]|nr:tRNA (adenosine(37)-N6)-dimethylallyltransferase MiaA [Bacteroidales bacterium]
MISELYDLLKKSYNLVTILGPTAGGKTSFATNLAYLMNSEIISADSRQVYKGMDLGTGKDIEDFFIYEKAIPYHLIDIVDAGEKYNLFQFQKDFFNAFKKISAKNKMPLMCGGTGLYLEAIVENYDLTEVPVNEKLREELENKSLPELTAILQSYKDLHNSTDIDTKKRAIRAIEIAVFIEKNQVVKPNYPKVSSFNIGIKFDRESQKRRITQRLDERLKEGMIEEVQTLLKKGISPETLIYYGLEYKYVTQYLLNEYSFEEMREKLNIAIHQFSKRQMTWFRRMEKKGVKIWWLDGHSSAEEKINRVQQIIKKAS